jgi:DNA mismatch endonuclease (patch repair protein)
MARTEICESQIEKKGARKEVTDWLTRAQRTRNMASIKSSDNRSTEQTFIRLLRSARVIGWRRHVDLPGKPDFVFPDHRLAIFLDGCFWHGCPRCYRLPQDNRAYWKKKVKTNRQRDRRVSNTLRRAGWRVVRIWEHCLENEMGRKIVIRKIHRELSAPPRDSIRTGR